MNVKRITKYLDPFVLCLLMVIALAFLFPNGAETFCLAELTSVGISGIFFLYGLKLSIAEVTNGLKNYPLHILVQLSTFVLFPAIIWILKPVLSLWIGDTFWMGLFYLSALPSSVSSSVIMVSLAKGNVPSAIFNASISGIIGVFATPLWMGLVMYQQENVSLQGIFLKLTLQILVPLVIGLSLNKKYGTWAQQKKRFITLYDKTIIVLIVYSSFCKSILTDVFLGISLLQILYLGIVIVALFWIMMGMIYSFARLLRLNLADQITAMFCGSKKSLIHGSAILKILFVNNPNASLFLLPVMLYHTIQLMILAVIANRLGNR
ncbi:bile acid:sodium symporter family protein [Ochrovirga pacifica]|uniref:bile acid:sodium symporter family protein n=1 Tax=Ochrovirga pacifica TaxID=1042376 RepID=UPI0002557FA2|nr:bile acid:sodium symporter family protein [Ochrovirga pacifica]